MMTVRRAMIGAVLGLLAGGVLAAGPMADRTRTPSSRTTAMMKTRNAWIEHRLLGGAGSLPFSFRYDGRPSSEVLRTWPRNVERTRLDAHRTRTTVTWADAATGLEVRCVAVDDDEFSSVEWTAWLRNAGTTQTPLIEDIEGIDAEFSWTGAGDPVIHTIRGDWCTVASFQPVEYRLPPGERKDLEPRATGKPCDGPDGWPYFNLAMPGGGVMLAVGWPGYWSSSFRRADGRSLRVVAGQEFTRLVLLPGEQVRTPLIALVFWAGDDVVEAQNLWRRWYRARVLPQVDGKPQPAVSQIQVGAREQDIAYVQSFLDAGITPDICWRDAGGTDTWYVNGGSPYTGNDGWLNTGTWEIDPAKFPNGMRPFSDWVRARGMQFLLWFEPERIGDPASWLATEHPEWLLPGTSHGSLLDLGNPETLAWLTNHVDALVKSQGLDWYREDLNGVGPLPAWRAADAPDRRGMTENLHVQGHLAFWDELIRRNPDLRIDSCASGGRRNDLESMRRSVPLLRSDFQFPTMAGVVEGNQGHTYGLSSWLPFQGTGVYSYDPYAYRSFYLPCFGMGALTAQTVAAQQKAYDECRRISTFMLEGDYYPLTAYSLALDAWIAWQFDLPEPGTGVVQAFRRGECAADTLAVRLHGLDPGAEYELSDFDTPQPTRQDGRSLMVSGLTIRAAGRPAAVIVTYRRLAP